MSASWCVKADSAKEKLAPKKKFAFSARKKTAGGDMKSLSQAQDKPEVADTEDTMSITPVRFDKPANVMCRCRLWPPDNRLILRLI